MYFYTYIMMRLFCQDCRPEADNLPRRSRRETLSSGKAEYAVPAAHTLEATTGRQGELSWLTNFDLLKNSENRGQLP